MFNRLLVVLMLQITLLNAQQVVLFYGSCSAGKSTLTQEIVNLDPNWCCIDEDAIFNELWLRQISNDFPGEYKLIAEALPHENLFQAMKNSTIIFPEDSTYSQKESVKNAIEIIQNALAHNDPEGFRMRIFHHFEMVIIDLIRERINTNKSVILDRWHTTPEMLRKAFSDILVQKVLVFSPLQETLDNFNKRNERAKQGGSSSSHRLYKHFIPSYVRLYKLNNDPLGALYCYQRSEVEIFFKDIRGALLVERTESKKAILFNDLTKERLDGLRKEFIPEKSHSDLLFLSPIDQYDFIINMQGVNPKRAALEFITRI